ncbi:MAG: polysaccharide biosynthesis tyrosine autokinase [Clostridia bacterium]|nr:polysaccharide biosynthesis tyrosine autokinase [Clostridia bacterium]
MSEEIRRPDENQADRIRHGNDKAAEPAFESVEEFYESIRNDAQKSSSVSITDFLHEFISVFRRMYLLPIILSVILSVILCVRARLEFNPIYQASATFTVDVNSASTKSSPTYSVSLSKQLSETFPYIFSSDVLINLIQQDLGLSSIPATITAEPVGQTNLFTIKVFSRTPQMSYNVLQSAINNYPRVADFVIGNTGMTLISDSGIPTKPTNSLSYKNELLKGVLFGCLGSLVIMIIATFAKNTVKDSDDLKKMLNLRCLGNVPYISRRRRANKSIIEISSPDISKSFSDSIRLIRSRIIKACDEAGFRTILVASSMPGEGKTTVAANIAMAMAMAGKRVALLDCDIRKPSDLGDLTTQKEAGLAEYLNGIVGIEDIVNEPEENLIVINGKTPSDEAAELMGTARMKELIEELLQRVDYIVMDSPPASVIADAVVLANISDCVLYVIRQEYTRKSRILDGLNHLSNGRAAFLGYVLNSADSDGGYGYGYGAYGKYARYGKYSRYGRYSSYGSYSKYGRYSRYGRYGSYSRYDSYSRYGSYSSTKKRKRKN